MAEWPKTVSCQIPEGDLPDEITYATRDVAVIPADLGVVMRDALVTILPFLSDSQAVVVREALLKYEESVKRDWRAELSVENENRWLGSYPTEDEALAAVALAAVEGALRTIGEYEERLAEDG